MLRPHSLGSIFLLLMVLLICPLTGAIRAAEPWTTLLLEGQGQRYPILADAVVLEDGGVISGILQPYPDQPSTVFLNRYDRHGNVIWTRELLTGLSNNPFEAKSMAALPDGDFLVFLHVEGNIPVDCGLNVWGCRITPGGELVWQKYYPMYDVYSSLSVAVTGAGRAFLMTHGGQLAEIDPQTGEILWKKLFWLIQSDGWNIPLSIEDVLESPDGELSLWAIQLKDRVYYWSLLRLDSLGSLISHKEYAKGANWAIADRAALQFSSRDLLILGKAHYEDPGDPNPYLLDRPWAMRLTPAGKIVWQRMYSDTSHYGSFGGGTILSNGIVRVAGFGGIGTGQGCRTALLGSLSEDGMYSEGRLYCPEEFATTIHNGWFLGIQSAPDASLVTWGGPSGAVVCGLGTDGDLAYGCADYDEYDTSYQSTVVQPTVLDILTGDSTSLLTCDTSASLADSDGPGWSVRMCGALYPGITSVSKIQNPFRLKVEGWNFEDGCRAYVNGFEVPVTKYKGESPDGSGRRKLIIGKGAVLKALCPKGESVTLTVINPDGRESVAFFYTR